MFTGIIEEIGYVEKISHASRSAQVSVRCRKVLKGTHIGDSIAVNGVCLTVTSLGSGSFTADVMDETYSRTSLKLLAPGSGVNLERAMQANGRFGGHIVAGHVDGIGKIVRITKQEMAVVYEIEVDSSEDLLRYIIQKGSITVDGISLTVASLTDLGFTISIIPHTISNTTLNDRKVGDTVNLETDIVGKYVERLLTRGVSGAGTSAAGSSGALDGDFESGVAFLTENGF